MFKFLKTIGIGFLLALSSPISAQSMTLCLEDVDYPPYAHGTDTIRAVNPGIMIEIVQDAAARAEVEISFIRRPWLRCQKLVAENKVHGLFAMIRSPEREKLFAFPSVEDHFLMEAEYAIFHHKRSNRVWRIEEIAESLASGKTITNYEGFGFGAPRGYQVEAMLRRHKLLATEATYLEKALPIIAKNRMDGFVIEKRVGQHIVNKHRYQKKIVPSSNSVAKSKWHVAINLDFYDKNPELIKKFWTHLSEARKAFQKSAKDFKGL